MGQERKGVSFPQRWKIDQCTCKRNVKPTCPQWGWPIWCWTRRGEGRRKLAGCLAGWLVWLGPILMLTKPQFQGTAAACVGTWAIHSSLLYECQSLGTGAASLVILHNPDHPDRGLIITVNQGLLLNYQLLLNKGASLRPAGSSGHS
jgi:hypothetical protein